MIGKQTTLDLNGPILSFIRQPFGMGICDGGFAVFTGIATASFPEQDPPNPASNTGFLSYQWSVEGFGPLTDGTFRGATVTGSGTTTLTITNATSPIANGLRLFVGVDYVPSAYSQPVGSAVTIGTGRSTGNAVNEILNSNPATLTVFPKILIIAQPQDISVDTETAATFNVNAELTDTSQGALSYRWLFDGQELSNSSTVRGATTPNLSIQYPISGVYSVQVIITHPVSCNSSLLSNEVVFGVVPPPQIITVETMTSSSSTATIQLQDLEINDQLILLAQNYTDPTTLISLFARGRNINVEMEIYGGKGNNSGSYNGGAGGYSKIKFTMDKNEEYVISGLNSINNNPFVYRKSSLIAVCGRGGDASSGGNGGDGGGIGISGQKGGGPSGGTGGQLISSGTLLPIGIFGSSSTASPRSPDTKATTPIGGRTIPCSKGSYWISRGFSPCQDVGISNFFYGSTEITNTSTIIRGFKQGYDIRQTAGSGVAPITERRLVSRTCTRTIPRTSFRVVPRTSTRIIPRTSTRTVQRTSTRIIPRTSTRTVQRTSFRTVSRSVTKSTSFTHFFDNASATTLLFTSSGDPMSATINGERGGTRSYDININVSGLELNSTNYTFFVSNTGLSAAGGAPILTNVVNFSRSGYTINLQFINADVGSSSFARNFTVVINGTANFQESFDDSYIESFDDSYIESFDDSYIESFDDSYIESFDDSYIESFDDSFTESFDCSYNETFIISGGGNGGSGATGGNGGGSGGGGGGGGSGYTDGSVQVLESTSGGNNDNARIVLRTLEPIPLLPPQVPTPPNAVRVEWNDTRNPGYKYGDSFSIGGNFQTVPGQFIQGPGGVMSGPPFNYATAYTNYRSGPQTPAGIFFTPSDSSTRDTNISYISFRLRLREWGPRPFEQSTIYLTSNRGNRDPSRGNVRRWYTSSQNQADSNPNLYTTNAGEAFVPFVVNFRVQFISAGNGNHRILTMTKSESYLGFGKADIDFDSAELARQNKLLADGSGKILFSDYFLNSYDYPRISNIDAEIINLDLNEGSPGRINGINMFTDGTTDINKTREGNFLEFGKYIIT